MATHIEERPKRGDLDFGDRPSTRVLTICAVTCDRAQIVKRDPTCSWCARKLEEKETAGRLGRIARS
jgi:hypothetical protein